MLLLSGVDRSVSQLAGAVRLSQSCTTRHLQALQRAGLVKRVRDGKRVLFRPAPRGATAAGVLAALVDDGWMPAESVPAAAASPQRAERATRPLAPNQPRAPRVRRATRPGASTAASRSAPRVAAPEPRPLTPIPAVESRPPQAAPESGKNSAPASTRPRIWPVLEDYLL